MNDETPQDRVSDGVLWRFRWMWAVVAALVLAAGAGAGMSMIFEPQYSAEAWLKIDDPRQFIAFADQSSAQVRTQVELIRSPVVLGKIMSNPEIAQMPEVKAQVEPLDWLKGRVHVRTANNSELFQVQFEGPDPTHAATIVNAIVAVYLELYSYEDRTQTDRTIMELEKLKMSRERDMERLRGDVHELTKQATGQYPNLVDPGEEMQLAQSTVRGLQDKLTQVEIDREVLELMLAARQKDRATGDATTYLSLVRPQIAADSQVQKVQGALAFFREKLSAYARSASKAENDSAANQLKADIAGLERSLAELESQLRTEQAEDLQQKLAGARKNEIATLQSNIEKQRALGTVYRTRLDSAQEALQKLSNFSLDLKLKRADLAREESVHERIAERVTVLKIEKSAPAQVSLLQNALVPAAPDSVDSHLGPITLAALGGFLLPLFVVSIWSSYRQQASGEMAGDPASPIPNP